MIRLLPALAILGTLLGSQAAAQAQEGSAETLTDSQIGQLLIRQSIARYSGPCPCPYNTMRNGRSCGRNSAYSKPGGASPLCYERDVSDAMVENYRRNRN